MIKLGLAILIVTTLVVLLTLLFMRGWLIETMRKEIAVLQEQMKADKLELAEWQRAFEQKHQSPWHIHTKGKTA